MAKDIINKIFVLIVMSSSFLYLRASDGTVNVNKQTGTYTVGDSKVKDVSSEMKGIYPPPSPKGMNGMIPRNFK